MISVMLSGASGSFLWCFYFSMLIELPRQAEAVALIGRTRSSC
jgi:hypothetical protein